MTITALIVDRNLIGEGMSRYGESAPSYAKENLFNYLKGFLDGYPLSELMSVLTDVIETIEWEKAEDE